MTTIKYGLSDAIREHLVSGQPITRLEAIVLFGVSNLTAIISEMRKQGWIVESRLTTYAAASKRLNHHAELRPPPNLPVREIMFTEYWISK